MKYLLLTVISLAVAVLLGQLIADDPGFVVIGYGGKVFRTSFVFFVVLLVIGIFALTFAWRALVHIFTLRTRWLGWTGEYRRKRSQRALSNGLLALAEGDFGRAEQLLSRGAEAESGPALHYLGAAEAAQAQNAAVSCAAAISASATCCSRACCAGDRNACLCPRRSATCCLVAAPASP